MMMNSSGVFAGTSRSTAQAEMRAEMDALQRHTCYRTHATEDMHEKRQRRTGSTTPARGKRPRVLGAECIEWLECLQCLRAKHVCAQAACVCMHERMRACNALLLFDVKPCQYAT